MVAVAPAQIYIVCAKRSETWKTRQLADRLPVSRLPVNVNKAVSEQEMRQGEKEDRRGEERRRDSGGGGGGGGGHNYKSLISSEKHKVSSQKGS